MIISYIENVLIGNSEEKNKNEEEYTPAKRESRIKNS
jgi:hypothetical protein